MALSWNPVRRGAIYCSPACGARCTHAAYLDCVAKAKALAAKLGPGWKPRVSENMCWYYGATKGVILVYPSNNHGGRPGGPGDCICYCNTNPQFLGRARDPRKAVAAAIAALDAHIVSVIEQRKALD